MDKSRLWIVLVVLMMQALSSASDLQESIVAIEKVLIDLNITSYNLKVYDVANANDRMELIARGIGFQSAKKSVYQLGNLKVLPHQTGDANEPPEWNVSVLVNGIWTTAVLTRSDNLYICAYWSDSDQKWRELDSNFLHPESEKMPLGGKYKDLNGERDNLTDVSLSIDSLGEAVRTLATTREEFAVKGALTVLVLMVSETQRFTAIRDCVLGGWASGCNLTKKDVAFLVYWGNLSCALIEGWPNVEGDTMYVNLRALMKHYGSISEKDAAGMLVVLLEGDNCPEALKDLTYIGPPKKTRRKKKRGPW